MARYYPITRSQEWHKGENKQVAIPVTDDEGVPVNLTGKDLRFTIAHTVGDDAEFVKSTGAGGVSIDTNIATVSSVAADTLDLPYHIYQYQLYSETDKLVLAYGPVWLLPRLPTEVA